MPALRSPDFIVTVHGEGVTQILDRVADALAPSALSSFMEVSAWPHFRGRIEGRFEDPIEQLRAGGWPPLSPATIEIKKSVGAAEPAAINIRSGEMREFLTTSHQIQPTAEGAELRFPRNPSDPIMRRKIQVAQQGDPGPNIMSAAMGPTPPRPVLLLDANDVVETLWGLSRWITAYVGSGGSIQPGAEV